MPAAPEGYDFLVERWFDAIDAASDYSSDSLLDSLRRRRPDIADALTTLIGMAQNDVAEGEPATSPEQLRGMVIMAAATSYVFADDESDDDARAIIAAVAGA